MRAIIKHRQTDRQTDERKRETETETDRQTDRDRESETERQRQREREARQAHRRTRGTSRGMTYIRSKYHQQVVHQTSLIESCTRSGGLQTQELKSHLVRTQSLHNLILKPGVGQYIAIHATLTARYFFLAYIYPSGPFTCIFPKTVCKNDTCPAEVRIRIASAMAAKARLKRIWR